MERGGSDAKELPSPVVVAEESNPVWVLALSAVADPQRDERATCSIEVVHYQAGHSPYWV